MSVLHICGTRQVCSALKCTFFIDSLTDFCLWLSSDAGFPTHRRLRMAFFALIISICIDVCRLERNEDVQQVWSSMSSVFWGGQGQCVLRALAQFPKQETAQSRCCLKRGATQPSYRNWSECLCLPKWGGIIYYVISPHDTFCRVCLFMWTHDTQLWLRLECTPAKRECAGRRCNCQGRMENEKKDFKDQKEGRKHAR